MGVGFFDEKSKATKIALLTRPVHDELTRNMLFSTKIVVPLKGNDKYEALIKVINSLKKRRLANSISVERIIKITKN